VRKCIVCGKSDDRERLVRFVAAPDGAAVADIAARLPGRGVWLHADRRTLALAIDKRLLQRHLGRRSPVAIHLADNLTGCIESQLRKSCLNILGLARRAGRLVLGFEAVRQSLESGSAAVLIAAADGEKTGRAKLAARAGMLPRVELFSNDELSLALGRENVVHAAVTAGREADKLLFEVFRLRGLVCGEAQIDAAPQAQNGNEDG